MAGIGRFPSGHKAIAGSKHWVVEDRRLSFVLEVDDTEVSDYGSDIGIDPQICVGDSLIYTELDAYSAVWAREGTAVDQSVRRVIRNRRFTNEFPADSNVLGIWLTELATQTRIPVRVQGKELLPNPISTLRRFSPEIREWFLDDLNRLNELGDSGFETLIADIMTDMGYIVRMVSPTRRKDGGVDIAAWPHNGMPYLIAVQVKHHHTQNKTSVSDVRDFAGTLERNPVFRFGLLVTNTTFTDDARHFQQPLTDKLRLRDGTDVKRWLGGGHTGIEEWNEIPTEVSLGLDVSFPVVPEDPRLDDVFWKFQKKSAMELLRELL